MSQLPWALYGACFFSALTALLVRLLAQSGLPADEVTFFRSSLCLLAMLPWFLKSLAHLRGPQVGAILLRCLTGALGIVTFYETLACLPFATAVLLNYTSPLWAGLFAWLFLKEKLSLGTVLAYPLALTGVLLVVGEPGEVGNLAGTLLGLFSAALSGAAYTALRGLRQTPADLVVGTLCLVTSLMSGPLCWVHYQTPNSWQWLGLMVCALCAAGAQILLTVGYRTRSTASASTIGLATVALSCLLSLGVLGENLEVSQWAGIALLLWSTSQTGRRSWLARQVRRMVILRHRMA